MVTTTSGHPGASNAPVGKLTTDEYSTREITDAQIDAAMSALDGIVKDAMERTGIPGLAVAVVRAGKVVYSKGFGIREVGKPEKIEPQTVFQLASVSKSVGATCIAMAVTKKIVKWSDPVTKYLPDFELNDPAVTKMLAISDCYSHRTGLPGAAGDDLEAFGFDRDYILSKLRLFKLSGFRISYAYTNFGMTTGAEAVAKAAGMSWEDFCAKEFYQPMGMTSTSSKHSDFLKQANRASIHFPVGGKKFEPLYQRDADAQSPAGGVSSTAGDMARWMAMCLAAGKLGDQPLIDPEALLQAYTPQIVNGGPATQSSRTRFYGYGVNVSNTSTGHVQWGHSGAFYVGVGTAFAMVPAADVGIVALTNAAPVGAAEAITTSFTDIVRAGTVERDWLAFFQPIFGGLFVNRSPVAEPAPASPAAARPLADYTGTYRNDDVRAELVRTALLDPQRWTVEYIPVTGSSNADLAAAALRHAGRPPAGDGAVLITDEQLAGRGRLGRRWHAPAGSSLMLSVLLRPDRVPMARRGWIGGLLGLAVVTAIRDTCALPAELKWPNDILIGGRKCAGVLAEVAGAAVVVGVGINVSLSDDELLAAAGGGTPGTSLLVAGGGSAPPDRHQLAAAVLDALAVLIDRWYAAAGDMVAAGLLDDYRAVLATLGAAVRVELPTGTAVIGTATDIAADGALLVRDAEGRQHRFSAADVVHLRPAAG